MAAKHEIEIIITPEGEVKLDIKGIKGQACVPIVKKLADQLGPVTRQDLTPEFYEQSIQSNVQKKTGP